MGSVVKSVVSLAAIVAGNLIGGPIGGLIASAIVSVGSALLFPVKRKRPAIQNQEGRLNAQFVLAEPRKMVFGETALATDTRFESWDKDEEPDWFHRVIACAAHKVNAIDEIWFDSERVWTSGGGIISKYRGYLKIRTVLEGSAANARAIPGTSWNTSARLTGCAYVQIDYKITSNDPDDEDEQSPFAQGITSRITIRGKGLQVYDPRQDSTVTGGSGAFRADDQTTWAYTSSNVQRNLALHILNYLLGWKIGGKLSVGRGIPPERIDLESFITAANICEESVSLNGGGSEPRYLGGLIASEADDPGAIQEALTTGCNAILTDAGGKISIKIFVNDLATPEAAFTDDDFLDDYTWNPWGALQDDANIIRGRYVDSSDVGLYQMREYSPISVTSLDGIDRPETLDLPVVESNAHAQRLAKTRLQRMQTPGIFKCAMKLAGLEATIGDQVTITFGPLGWTAKNFRIADQSFESGKLMVTFTEENAAFYAWSAEDVANITPGTPQVFNPAHSPLLQSIANVFQQQKNPRNYITDTEPMPVNVTRGDTSDDRSLVVTTWGQAFREGDLWLTESGKTVAGWRNELAMWELNLADLTKSTTGATSLQIDYDHEGTLTSTLPITSIYSIAAAGGDPLSTGVSWEVATRLATGQSTADIWSGSVPTMTGSGKGVLRLNSGLEVTKATIDITATVFGVKYPAYAVTINKVLADPPAGGGGGGGSGTSDSGTVTGTLSGTTYVQRGPTLTVTTGSSDTSVDLTAGNISITPSNNEAYSGSNIKGKWQYESAPSTWTDVGSEADSNPDPFTFLEEPGLYDAFSGSLACNRSQGSLSSSTEYNFRFMMRVSSGETTKPFDLGGTISAVSAA